MRKRLRHALDWRLRAVTERLDRLTVKVDALQATLDDRVSPLLEAIAAEDAETRRRLSALRASPSYEAAWERADPLVSVTIPTHDRPRLLVERGLASVLAQTYERLEVLVVGDAAGAEVETAVAAVGDPRVRWANLTQRIQAHPDPRRHWLVASGMARNEAARLATGDWVLHFDDDDALRPDAVARLLVRARETRAEVVYGGFEAHRADGTTERYGEFPPRPGDFAWQGAIAHAGLPFERQLVAAHVGVPGDRWLLERMLRAGVRFAAVGDPPVWDYFPSQDWES